MSETYTKTFAEMQQAARGIALALTVGLAASLGALADGEIALKNVTADANKQLVVQFAAGQGAPQAPRMTEVPSPNHQLLIDFTGVTLDENSVPSADQLSKALSAQIIGVRSATVANLANAPTPTVRVVLGLDPDMVIKPSIAALQDGLVSISLGDNAGAASAAGASNATASSGSGSSAAASDPAAAYEEYYRKFLQQKQLNSQIPSGDWGPRRGTIAEARTAKHGVRVIGTPVDSPVMADVPKEKVAAQPARQEAPAPAAEQSPAPEAPAAAAQQPAAEAAPAPGAAAADQTAGAAPAPEAAAAAQTAEAAPTAKEEAPAQAQPDMVADGEAAATKTAPAAAPVEVAAAAAPARRAPRPGTIASENESAAAPSDSAAAAAGDATMEGRNVREQDKPENQPQVTSPADDKAAEPPRRKARRIFNEAVANHLHGHINQAVAGYKEAIKIDPELGDAYSNLGLAYNQMHNYASALNEFHKALAINPRDAITYNGVGAALRAENDMPGAIKNWETAVKLDNKLAVAHYNLGTAYESEGDLDKAMVSYEEAVRNDQHLGEAYFRMGLIMQKRHRLADAKAHYKQALKVSADSDYAAEAKAKIAAIDKLAK